MEKLELKYLLPYLPYEIKYACDNKIIRTIQLKDVIHIIDNDNKKPIMYPLSEIKQFEDIMDEFSEYSWDAFENHFFCDLLGRSLNCFDVVNYTIMELCFKHHLDIFGLIEKGLAVSYLDVQSSSNEG